MFGNEVASCVPVAPAGTSTVTDLSSGVYLGATKPCSSCKGAWRNKTLGMHGHGEVKSTESCTWSVSLQYRRKSTGNCENSTIDRSSTLYPSKYPWIRTYSETRTSTLNRLALHAVILQHEHDGTIVSPSCWSLVSVCHRLLCNNLS